MLALLKPLRRQEQKSAAKRGQRLLKAAQQKLGCAFSHSAERMVDELAYCTLKTVFFRRMPSWLSPSIPGKPWKFAEKSPLNAVCSLLAVLLSVFPFLASTRPPFLPSATAPPHFLPLPPPPNQFIPASHCRYSIRSRVTCCAYFIPLQFLVPRRLLDSNMIHCFHQQLLARTVRTLRLHKPVVWILTDPNF